MDARRGVVPTHAPSHRTGSQRGRFEGRYARCSLRLRRRGAVTRCLILRRYPLLVRNREATMDAHRRRIQPNRTLDLFAPSPLIWDHLPERTRRWVVGLLARVLIAHARGEAPEPGSDTDER